MTTLQYPDAYLAKFCDEEREARAFINVDLLDTTDDGFTTDWRNRLTVVQCYILACLENQSDPEDLFTAKLSSYTKEFDGLLSQARTAAVDSEGNYATIFTVNMERA